VPAVPVADPPEPGALPPLPVVLAVPPPPPPAPLPVVAAPSEPVPDVAAAPEPLPSSFVEPHPRTTSGTTAAIIPCCRNHPMAVSLAGSFPGFKRR
jgi:hypothetical protein